MAAPADSFRVDQPTGRALVLGPDGIERSAVELVLEDGGVELVDGDTLARLEPSVVVLVEPEARHWSLARSRGVPVVYVTRGDVKGIDLANAVIGGAVAVLRADAAPDAMVAAVRCAGDGGSTLEPSDLRTVADAIRAGLVDGARPTLTQREADVLHSIAEGDSVKQTARLLGISAKTVENHQSRLFRKLGARNRAEAISRAYALRILVPPDVAFDDTAQ
jgi:DNA-binding NarL/FixJ family response regulator